jgi:hypothetical protein
MRTIKLRLLAFCMLTLLFCSSSVALGDWEPNDGHKMHFPQLPDINGWDVLAYQPRILADDWTCSYTGPIEDIHFWGSVKGDITGLVGHVQAHLMIYSNVPDPDPENPLDYSHPGELLWSHDFEGYATGIDPCAWEGWLVPDTDFNIPVDHNHFYLYNVDIPKPNQFQQTSGTTYWLVIQVSTPQWGWKTADVNSYPEPFTGKHYMDDAVWSVNGTNWFELRDPNTDESLDLAFVITGSPKTPTVTEWGLIIMAGALLTAGAIVIVRRRRVAAA